jgi:hypothetical protein
VITIDAPIAGRHRRDRSARHEIHGYLIMDDFAAALRFSANRPG